MVKGSCSGKKKGDANKSQDHGFADLIFSWSLDDILNDNLYQHQVEKIPLTFQSEEHYFGSFVYPLLEETRTELASTMNMMYKAPFADISSFKKAKGKEKLMYDVTVGDWRNSERRKERYRTLPGDLLILTNGEPGSVSDLQTVGSTWAFLLVNNTADDDSGYDGTPVQFKVTASQKIEFHEGMFVVFLMNITTQKRIWNSLRKHANLDIIKEILYPDSVVKEKCDMCSVSCNTSVQGFDQNLVSKLNKSQKAAIMAAIRKMKCCHKSSVEQIWGPPGTGKTMTVSVMLSIFLQLKCRTLTCAPTNVAIVAVASRVLSLVKESSETKTASGDSFCSIGDVLLFGNKDRLKVGTNIEEIYLDHRVEKLTECLGSMTGLKHCIKSMIDLLEDCASQYHVFVENGLLKEEQITNEMKSKTKNLKVKSFMEFVREQFNSCALPLKKCIVTFCTHIPRSFMKQENFQTMVSLLDSLSSLESLLSKKNMVSEELENIFVVKPLEDDYVKSGHMSSINSARIMSLSLLKTLQTALGGLKLPGGNRDAITRFCYERASLIFCTTSTSYKLQKVKMEPLKLLVIDEAAQMKECEAIIPLQIPGMKHAILIGDECQLPATVKSNVSNECGLGRSLFERLSLLDHSKHLLNVQYRMHPRISSFPNKKFYHKQILDAKNVTCKSYGRQYLSGPMFGPYSFINIIGGREEGDDVGSKRNMVEVSLVIKIVQKLYKACHQSKKKLSIGVVSPYTAQVVSIEEKLRYKYEKCDGFSVTVKSIDGFQGGEEDIIILSTVRSNSHGSVGFISSPQRTNVALTRARHCLWILGNERTLARSDSIWKDLVCDARNRGCLFDADADECLKKIIIDAKKELEPLNDMVKGNSLLLKHVKWKILFSDNFRKSFGKLMDSRMKNVVVDLLQKLSGGWRPNDGNIDCKTSSKVLKTYKIEGLHVICTIDIIKELKYIQVLKVWDILPSKEIPKLRKQLDNIFAAYTDDYMNRCTTKHLEGNLEIPKSWVACQEIIQFRKVSNYEGDNEVSMNPGAGGYYVDNSELSESLLHMKFYSLSPGMVNHLRVGREIDLPMRLSDEQMEIFLCPKSSFIFGRLGTGKTTILTMKLLQNEQSFRSASEGLCDTKSIQDGDAEVVDDHKESKPTVLHQLFVTVCPKSCHLVKQHVSNITSVSCDGNSSAEIYLDESESHVPDTFVDIPEKSYPLVITFHKFLMMLDGTLGNSFFERFHEAREGSHGNHISSRSVALQTFIRSRDVTFDRFCSHYWPHFDRNLTKKLDPFRVFTEINFHIKGGLQAEESCDGKVNYEGFSLLTEGHASTLSKQKRKTIDTLFEAYEKMKGKRGDFDLGDLVNDLHHRLKTKSYEGDQMDFIYIDEVQDLSMRQISLFKYMCQNVDEGFVFAGDTEKTIARGIDVRFEDMKSMFFTEFLGSTATGEKEKGRVPEIFQLKQNSITHGGVLKLAQSVIDILYCYFAHSIGILEPENSLISGEAPVLLKSGKDKNAILTIFGDTGTSGDIVGFGAEQVILVRDDSAKTEICKYVGKQALVLTIAESKGLEFQDVLLYNFFGSSPLKDQWSVIYGYMKEQDWLDEKLHHSFPSFKESKHNVLCSELKQLYVALTRTRQRLWICETKEELSKPMFDYWKRRGLIQVRKLNDSVARAMRCASSPQEWLERGKKLFYENIYVMATMCFERAGDLMWETMAKAFGLRTSADQKRGTNPEEASCNLREAAEMFESIGKFELAATCYCDLGEHEIAGKIYLDKCGQIDAAAECFRLARCYSDAAAAYAKGYQFSNCLSVCIKGELFDKGLKYIGYWKEYFQDQNKELEQIEQEFLESCALSYYERKDPKSMMKFVRAFCSLESKRVFLRSIGYLDDHLSLEKKSGHFVNAAELVGLQGDVLKEAGLLEMAGRCEEAILLILWYVSSISLWGNGNTGWPLKQFAQKKKLCEKARSLAKMHSNKLHDMVCSEINVLSHRQGSLSKVKKKLHISQQHKSLRGEFILIRKMLEAHLQSDITYDLEEELPIDTNKYVEDKVSQNRISFITLVFYFNLWKVNVMDIFQSLESLDNEQPNKHEYHVDFTLNYFGMRKQCVKGNIVYLLVNKDMDWIRNVGDLRGLGRDGEILTLDGKQLVHAMRSYWQSELVSVGLKVLETLQWLYNSNSINSAFHQSTSLLHIYEVSKFLLDCQYLDLTFHHTNSLQDFLESSVTYLDFVFPLDWRRSVSRNLISLRETDLSLNLLEEVILQPLKIEYDFTYWTIGRVMMICLSSKKSVSVYEKIIRGLEWNPLWKSFFERFWEYGFNGVYVAPALQSALEDTYRTYWQLLEHSCGSSSDSGLLFYMSPDSFVYLVDRLLFMASFSSGYFFTTKSSFVEWYTSTPDTTLSASKQLISKDIADFLVVVIQDILYKKEETVSWIERSNIVASYYHPLIALKLLMIVSLVSLQLLDYSQVLIDLLSGCNNIAYLLPQKFVGDLLIRRNGSNLNLDPDMVAEAFASVMDPLLIVDLENATPRVHAPCAIFVDLRRPREEIMSVLFPSKTTLSGQQGMAEKNSWNYHTALQGAKDSWDDLKQHSRSDDSHDPTKQTFVEREQSSRAVLDGFLNQSVASQECKVKQKVGLDCRNMTEAPHEENHVEEIGDEHRNGDHSLVDLEVEKQSSNNNTYDSGSGTGIGNSRRKKSEKSICSNTQDTTLQEANDLGDGITTLQEANNSLDDLKQPCFASDMSQPEVELSVSTGDKMEEAGDEHSNDYHSPLNLVLEEESNNENTQDAEIKQGNRKNKGKMNQKNKGSLNTLIAVLVDRQQRSGGETSLSEASNACNDLKQPSCAFDTSRPEVEMSVSKSDEMTVPTPDERLQSSRPMEDGLLSQTVMDLEALHDFEEENDVEQTGDHSPVELVLENEISKDNTQDAEIKKGRQRTRWKSKKGKVRQRVVKLEIKKQSNKNSTQDSGSKTVTGNSRRKKSKKNRGSNTQHTLATVLLDGQPCAREGTILLQANNSWNDHTTLPEAKNSWDDLTTLDEAHKPLDDLKQPSFASDMSRREVKRSVSTSGKKTTVQPTSERLQSSKRGGLKRSNATEDTEIKEGKGKNKGRWIEKKGKVKSNVNTFTGDEHSNVHSPVNLVLEKQTKIDKTKDVEIKKGKAKEKGKCVKKNKGINSLNTFTGDEKRSDHSVVVVQARNGIIKNVEAKNGKGKNTEKWIKKNKGSSSVNTSTADEHSNVHSPVDLVLEKQTRIDKTKDVEIKEEKGKNKGKCVKKNKGINSLNTFTGDKKRSDQSVVEVQAKKGKGKNMDKWIKKNKCSSSVNTSTADEHSSCHSVVDLVLESQTSNENIKNVEIKKGKGKILEKCIKKTKDSNSLNTCTGDEHSNDLSQLELVLQKQTSNEITQDAEIKKGKGKSKNKKDSNSLNTFTTVLVDGHYYAGEGTTLQEANTTCNDLKQPSSASDTSRPEVELLVSESETTTVQAFVERLQSRPVVDGFLNYVGSESSRDITEVLQEENHVEETDDDHSKGDHSMSELMLEKQSSNDDPQDVEDKKREGKYVAGEVTMMCEENSGCNDMKPPSSAFDTGIKTLDKLKFGSMLGVAAAFLGISAWKKT